jgi:type IV secretory pathway VirB6-like protein
VVKRLKRAARLERVLRTVILYGMSLMLLVILLSPLWIALLFFWR